MDICSAFFSEQMLHLAEKNNSFCFLQATVKVPLSQPCFDHFFGPVLGATEEVHTLVSRITIFSEA